VKRTEISEREGPDWIEREMQRELVLLSVKKELTVSGMIRPSKKTQEGKRRELGSFETNLKERTWTYYKSGIRF